MALNRRPYSRDTVEEGIKVGGEIWEEKGFAEEDKAGERRIAKGERSR